MTVTVTDALLVLLTRSANKDRDSNMASTTSECDFPFVILLSIELLLTPSFFGGGVYILSKFHSLSSFPPSPSVRIRQVSGELEIGCLKEASSDTGG